MNKEIDLKTAAFTAMKPIVATIYGETQENLKSGSLWVIENLGVIMQSGASPFIGNPCWTLKELTTRLHEYMKGTVPGQDNLLVIGDEVLRHMPWGDKRDAIKLLHSLCFCQDRNIYTIVLKKEADRKNLGYWSSGLAQISSLILSVTDEKTLVLKHNWVAINWTDGENPPSNPLDSLITYMI